MLKCGVTYGLVALIFNLAPVCLALATKPLIDFASSAVLVGKITSVVLHTTYQYAAW